MAANTKPAAKAVESHIQNADVVRALNEANQADQTVSLAARQAATLANDNDFTKETDKAKRLDVILALYMPILTRKSVKEQFSAALAVLVEASEVRIAASAVTTKADGKVTFSAPEALSKGEAADPTKSVTTLKPTEAVANLTSNDLKQAATVARENLGKARASGGGRKSTKNTESTRAPFFDELAAVLKDGALSMQMFAIVAIAAKQQPTIIAACQSILEQSGYQVTRAPKKS